MKKLLLSASLVALTSGGLLASAETPAPGPAANAVMNSEAAPVKIKGASKAALIAKVAKLKAKNKAIKDEIAKLKEAGKEQQAKDAEAQLAQAHTATQTAETALTSGDASVAHAAVAAAETNTAAADVVSTVGVTPEQIAQASQEAQASTNVVEEVKTAAPEKAAELATEATQKAAEVVASADETIKNEEHPVLQVNAVESPEVKALENTPHTDVTDAQVTAAMDTVKQDAAAIENHPQKEKTRSKVKKLKKMLQELTARVDELTKKGMNTPQEKAEGKEAVAASTAVITAMGAVVNGADDAQQKEQAADQAVAAIPEAPPAPPVGTRYQNKTAM